METKLLTSADLREKYGVSTVSLYYYRNQKKDPLPFIGGSGTYLYDPEIAAAWFKSHNINAKRAK